MECRRGSGLHSLHTHSMYPVLGSNLIRCPVHLVCFQCLCNIPALPLPNAIEQNKIDDICLFDRPFLSLSGEEEGEGLKLAVLAFFLFFLHSRPRRHVGKQVRSVGVMSCLFSFPYQDNQFSHGSGQIDGLIVAWSRSLIFCSLYHSKQANKVCVCVCCSGFFCLFFFSFFLYFILAVFLSCQ